MLKRLWRWLGVRGRGRWGTFLRVVFFWNPLVAVVMNTVFDKWKGWAAWGEDVAASIVIGTVSIVVCFAMIDLVVLVERRVFLRRGLPPPEHSLNWNLLVSAAGLPLGAYLGFWAASLLLGVRVPGFHGLGFGVGMGVLVISAFGFHQALGDLRDARRLIELKEKDAENERLRGRVAALTAQMNPHLLFNSLNTIASLTQTDPDAAEGMTVELAQLYRGVLHATQKELHPLDEELEICRAYLGIEKARFGDRLCFEIAAEGLDGSRPIPPLLLQALVENAVKHGLAPRKSGGTVRIDCALDGEDLMLKVADDGVGYHPEVRSDHQSTGLDNLRARLRLLYGERASLELRAGEDGGTQVSIRIPSSETSA